MATKSLAGNNAPLVSVAILTYNHSKFLRECLDSVLSQSYPNLEIVVADDCSSDQTAAMLLSYAEKHPKRMVLSLAEKNRGVTKNANVALKLCTGKYIAWLGGDDLMLPGKVATQVSYMESNSKCVISFHNVDVFNSETGAILRKFNDWKTPQVGAMNTIIKEKTYNCACATMSRAAYCPSGGFDEHLPLASDWKFWLESLSTGGEMHYIPQVLGRYRRHANNLTERGGETFKKCQADHLDTIRWIMTDYPQYGAEAIIALAETLRQMRWISKSAYFPYLKMSLAVKLSFKAIASYLVYRITWGRVSL